MKSIIYSKYDCPYCDKAKSLLLLKGYEIEERKIGDGYTKEDLLEAVPLARSVPQIFIGEKYIGGYFDLEQYIEETAGGFSDAN